MQMRVRITMIETPASSSSSLIDSAGNACVAAISVIHIRCILRAMKARVGGATWLTALRTDSSLEFWQAKNFLCSPARSLGRAR
jgi:hypothetical protein